MDAYFAQLTVLAAAALDVTPEMWKRVARAITRRNGKVVTVGTGTLIATFGLEDSAAPGAAVEAALALRDELRESHPFRVTVAIASGVVTVKPLDAEGRVEIEGEPLDLATELLRVKARQGGVFLAGSVSSELRGRFRLHDDTDRMTQIKGRAEPIPVYEVLDDYSSSALAQLAVDNEPEGGDPAEESTAVRPARTGIAMPPLPPGVRQDIVTDRPPLTALNKVYGNPALLKMDDMLLEAMQGKVYAPQDWVVCTVFAPPTVARSEAFLVQVFTHLSESAGDAAALAVEFDPAATRRVFQSLETRIARGTRLTFELTMRGAEIEDPVARLVWNGRTEAVQFGVSVSSTAKPGPILGTVTVSQDSVPVGHLKFKLQVVSQSDSGRIAEPVGDSARRYSTAFVSYASQDRDKVLARVQMLRPLGIHYFQDILDLEPGVRWQRELYRRIDECDLFLLFWSQSAKQSPWVLKEAKYALARKGDDDFGPPEIMPVILEGPPIPRPPPELEHLHFNDRLIYFMSSPAG